MTLGRQLMLSGLVVLVGLFAGMMGFMVKNTQHFLNAQLSEHSQETANFLGLSLSTLMKKEDKILAGRMVDSIWDAGYYKKIKVEGLDGADWVSKEQKIKFDKVPDWFITVIPLETQVKEAVIQSGWMQIGKVKVESNPGFAYKQIWQTTIDSFIWLALISWLAIMLGGVLLYVILRPLRAITKQANALCNQQFSVIEPLPWTFDLRQVVEAMNKMSRKLQSIFEANARESLALQKQAYQSPVTELGNRRYFDLQLSHLIQYKEYHATGVLLLLEISDFQGLNQEQGYNAGDVLLKQVASLMRSVTVSMESAVLAHLGGANFAIVLPKKTKEESIQVAQRIIERFIDIKVPDHHLGIGLCLISDDHTISALLAKADMALRKAQSLAPNSWCFSEVSTQAQTAQPVYTAAQWADLFKRVIQHKEIILHYQPYILFEAQGKKAYHEILLRLKDGDKTGALIPAGMFIPMAERLGFTAELDKLVISTVVEKVRHQRHADQQEHYYSINLSPLSLGEKGFIEWVLKILGTLGKQAQHIVIELPEYGVINRIEQVKDFYSRLSNLGCQTAIDHYGKGFSSFSYLRSLRINFLKIDGSYMAKLESNEENQFFIRSLVDIAHTVDIKVIAESVETQAELEMSRYLKVDGAQGYFLGRPEARDPHEIK